MQEKGGLVIFRHNEIRDKVLNLPCRAFTPMATRNQPLIHGRTSENMRTLPNEVTNQNVDKEAATGEDESGDLLILGFVGWRRLHPGRGLCLQRLRASFVLPRRWAMAKNVVCDRAF
jgi:hypothetical protein